MARTYNPPHEPRDKKKLASMVETLRKGGKLPPIVVVGENALTGSHRLAAWLQMDIEPNVLEINDELYGEAVRAMGLDPFFDDPRDMSELAENIFLITEDPEVKKAFEDQIC